jgi:hypothetical protein
VTRPTRYNLQPKEAAAQIAGRVAFRKGSRVID